MNSITSDLVTYRSFLICSQITRSLNMNKTLRNKNTRTTSIQLLVQLYMQFPLIKKHCDMMS
jgi:hypothetical protein